MPDRPDYAQRMVGWYDPPQLLRTGALVLVSQQFALHADNREIQALATPNAEYADYGDLGRDNLWIDFVADTGDGWNSTYAVASTLAQERLHLERPDGQDVLLERGRLLIFGGDLIYPTPTGQGYDDRLLKPYFDALTPDQNEWPDVWALPGNHDWYDSLSAFRRLFCTEQDFGPWRSRQRTSYFAAKLPHGWWLFGVDVQLLHDIDHRQLGYFAGVLELFEPQDRVILVCPEPYWVEYVTQPVGSSKFVKSLFQTLREMIGDRLRLSIAGDLHYYQRLSTPDCRRHLVTCGSGGAFLHPTHVADPAAFPQGFRLEGCFPSINQSRRLTRRNLLFLFRNPLFGVLPGFFYLLVAWATGINIGEKFSEVRIPELGRLGISDFWTAVQVGIQSAILSPVGVGFYAIIFAAFIVFTNSKSKVFRWVVGPLHGLTHVVVGFFLFWAASYVCLTVLGLIPKSVTQYLLASVLIVLAAWICGSIVMGLYLWISLEIFREHQTEAFSSLRVSDWKGFLRLRLRPGGRLDIYFIGIERVPRRWRERGPGGTRPRWISNDAGATQPRIYDSVTLEPT